MFVLLALACAAPAAGPVPAEVASGMWAGGFGKLEGKRPRWYSIEADVEDGKIEGRYRYAFDYRDLAGKVEDGGVSFTVRAEGEKLRCRASLDGGALLGACDGGGETLTLRLVPEVRMSEAELDARAGYYRSEDGRRLAVRRSRHLLLTDLDRGDLRALYAEGGDTFSTGRRFAVPHPRESTVVFLRDAGGAVDGMEIRTGETILRAVRQHTFRTEEFRFESEGLTLAGTLFLPTRPGPHPGVVWVHGSGKQTRSGAGNWSYYFADKGFAFLAVDKRGTGESEGRYALNDGTHDNYSHMRRRALDVRAAVEALQARPDVIDGGVGLMGGSQAGWVQPMAAAGGDVAFTITLSGGATQLNLEGRFSRWADEGGSGGDSIAELIERLRRVEPGGHDFRDDFRAQTAPGLWLYGGLDRSNPSRLCIEMIEEIARENGNDFSVRLFPEGNHALWAARTGGAAEYGTLERLVPGLVSTIDDWLQAQDLLPGPKSSLPAPATAPRSRVPAADRGLR